MIPEITIKATITSYALDLWFPSWRDEAWDLHLKGWSDDKVSIWISERELMVIRLKRHCQLGDR